MVVGLDGILDFTDGSGEEGFFLLELVNAVPVSAGADELVDGDGLVLTEATS